MKRWHPWFWIFGVGLVVLGWSRLRFEADVLDLLPEALPVVQGLKLYQSQFANARELIVTVQSNDPLLTEEASLVLATALRSQTQWVRQVIWQPPWQEHPALGAELPAYLWLNQNPAYFAKLRDRLDDPSLGRTLEETRRQLAVSLSPAEMARLSYDPLRLTELPQASAALNMGSDQGLFASADGTFRVMQVQATSYLAHYRDCAAWLDQIRQIERRLRQDGRVATNVALAYTGRPAFVAEIASSMERDILGSVTGTFIVITLLFFLAHRTWKPLLWLSLLLAVVLGATTALGGLLYDKLNVLSMGFAAILLGLGVDYGLVLYQEALVCPQLTASQIVRVQFPGILWSALTTAIAFLLLNRCSLPGLGQLGTLVAGGILIAAALMLRFFLNPLLKQPAAPATELAHARVAEAQSTPWIGTRGLAWMLIALFLSSAAVCLNRHPPSLKDSTQALRPRHSLAYDALDQIKQRLDRSQEPLLVLISGTNETQVHRGLRRAESVLDECVASGLATRFMLPGALWPIPEHQAANKPLARQIASRRAGLERAILDAGFTTNALALTRQVLEVWDRAGQDERVFWPDNQVSAWILSQGTARAPGLFLALGVIHLPEDPQATRTLASRLERTLPEPAFTLASWSLLGSNLADLIKSELVHILVPMVLALILCLAVAFRAWGEVGSSLLGMLVSGALLILVMEWAGWSWNLINLMALPLLLGAGIDYSIHAQLALRRHNGDARAMRRTAGRAVFLCAATSAAGFGSLAFSSNAGLASLGQVGATGLILCYLTHVYLMPSLGLARIHHD